MTTESIKSKSIATNKMPLWFWVVFSTITALTLVSTGLYFAKNTRLAVAAQQDQTPLIQQRDSLLNESDILQSNWLKTLNPLAKKIQGDLVWSNQQQKGYMRFANLPELSEQQVYHLWIYDLEYSLKAPISATKFQADPHVRKEFVVEVVAEKVVKKPYKFVLKLEMDAQPDQILLLAQP
ncbi:MAG TPA: anti-sigma factor [Leucothrix mucor]|uniref:Anti-sigma factor n=1 Tax=Leucothrix mucor TaxID=45248 RepID=A0A7V2SXU0_LEUMU|nr:anti-sigma factor [Leucothrix mucor]